MFNPNVFYKEVVADNQGRLKRIYVAKNIDFLLDRDFDVKEDLKCLVNEMERTYEIYYMNIKFNDSYAKNTSPLKIKEIINHYLDKDLVLTLERHIERDGKRYVALDNTPIYKLSILELYGENDNGVVFLSGELTHNTIVCTGSLTLEIADFNGYTLIDEILERFGTYSSKKKQEIDILERMLS